MIIKYSFIRYAIPFREFARLSNVLRYGIPVFIFLFAACKKKDVVRSTTAQLLVLNASPNAGAVELQQNLKPVGSFTYLNGINPSLSYITIDSGFNNYKIKKAGNEVVNWLFANQGLSLSLFIADTLTTTGLKYFFLTDNLDTTGLGKRSKIRFVHLSPNTDTVELATTRPSNILQDSPLINYPYFGNYAQAYVLGGSGFQNFYADSTVTIKFKKKSDSSLLNQYQYNFKKGGVYTLLLKGYSRRAGSDSLSLSIIQHN